MTGEAKAPVLTARRAAQHIRLFEAYDACKRLCSLTVPPSLAPSPRYARRYTVSSRFWCHSYECGYIVEGLRTVCCLAAPTFYATCDGTHGLIRNHLLVRQSFQQLSSSKLNVRNSNDLETHPAESLFAGVSRGSRPTEPLGEGR
jgi:hypothetical protein